MKEPEEQQSTMSELRQRMAEAKCSDEDLLALLRAVRAANIPIDELVQILRSLPKPT